jgi:hypothetical protein
MAGMGPPPKDPALRARKNKPTTAAVLETPADPESIEVPPLPVRACCALEDEEPQEEEPKRKKRGRPARKKKPKPVCRVCRGTRVVPYHPRTIAAWEKLCRDGKWAQYHETERDVIATHYAAIVDRIHWSGASADLEDLKEDRLFRARWGLDPQRPVDAPRHDPRKVLLMATEASKRA